MVFCKDCKFVAKGSKVPFSDEWNCLRSKLLNFQTDEYYLGRCKVKNYCGECEDYKEIPK